ncbi:MAG: citrate lyase subunit beta/citryl-CoA lyase [Paraglaciecola psychrophila]|jgi:citrate lyase subunit beta/citryl-CoA lyase
MANNSVYKSLLFVPASRQDMAERAHQRGAGGIILDLEDGVAAEQKPAARATLNSLLQMLQDNRVTALVRINSLETGGRLDIAAIDSRFTPALLIPKVTTPAQLLAVQSCWTDSGKALSSLQLLPMIECPQGLFQASAIATTSEAVVAMIFGSEDFAAEAGLSTAIDALAMPAQWLALAASAAGIAAYGLPGSLANYQDMALFESTVKRAKTIGFAGSLCVHPKQVAVANTVFRPTDQELTWAQAVVAQGVGGGATGGAMGMVDAPVLARAQAILARL